ncbi:MAG: alpha/beta hydrolase [Lachnospiraceae bacterium]|nr:alpha/beta hydrolase [Lachnospiraceae bacterium]
MNDDFESVKKIGQADMPAEDTDIPAEQPEILVEVSGANEDTSAVKEDNPAAKEGSPGEKESNPVKERKRLREKLKKPFVFIKEKTERQRTFLREGAPGGMIAELVLGTQFFIWIVDEMTLGRIPIVVVTIIAAALLVLCTELGRLLISLIFGGAKRKNSYFIMAFAMVMSNNMIGNQAQAVPGAIIMSLALALSADVLGRCVFSFFKSRAFKQIFGYAVIAVTLAYLIFYGVFFHKDIWGESRVDYYNRIKENMASGKGAGAAGSSEGFEKYLEDGGYSVATLSYGPEEDADIVTETLDYSGFDSVKNRDPMDKFTELFSNYDFEKVPVKGQIWYPEGLASCPVFFMVHGAHDSATPSYLGYEYLGKYLASNGYVTVSVDENLINELSEGNDKRAIMLLDNMKAILDENKREGSPIEGLIDPQRIAIGGHSRGGEMAATAYLFNDLDAYPEDGNVRFDYHFPITSVVAIAPVVDQYMPVSQSVRIRDVNYLLIHGSNDQDVSSMMGEKQYNNVTFSGEETFLKSAVYILGANHGQFNSLWGRYDMAGATNGYLNTCHFLDESEQKKIAKAYIRTFLDTTLGIDDTYASLLRGVSGFESELPDTGYVTNYEDSSYVNLCPFDNTADISSYDTGVTVSVSDASTWTIDPYERGKGGEGEDFVLSLSWDEDSSPSVTAYIPGIDISEGALCFRIADMREDTEELEEGLNYTVKLTDVSGNSVSIDSPVPVFHSLAVQLYKQDVFFNSYEYKHQLQTVSIGPEMFPDAAGFDFSDIRKLEIGIDGTQKGNIILNDVGYYAERQ